jgi:COMM domain containing 4
MYDEGDNLYLLFPTAQNEAQSLLSSLEFILGSASRFSTSEEHLRAELQQVGLPKETAAAISKVHQDSTSLIREKLIEKSLRSKSFSSF